nr:hypothetical protein [Tanacetum cinerariifolium]
MVRSIDLRKREREFLVSLATCELLQGWQGEGSDQEELLPRELLVWKPTTLGDTLAFAQITEAHLEGHAAILTGTTTKIVADVTPQRQSVPCFRGVLGTANTTNPPLLPNSTKTYKPLAIKWISPTERQERLNKGLCFNCDNWWTRGHKCSGKIGKSDVHVLIDNGSTHNFIRLDVVEKICLPIKSTKAFKVYIGSGESLLCESVCSSVTLHMQGVVTHNYAHQTIEFTLLDTTYSLKGDDSLYMKKISLHQMQAMLKHDDVYRVYEIHYLSIETEVEEMSPKTVIPRLVELEQLFIRFDSLFQVPTTLPPHRSIDHRIRLLPDSTSVNVRPYRYPHYQKREIEKFVNEMLSQGIICYSQSPFSSLVLLVKKKDGSYCFRVDYRPLNAVMVKDKFPVPTADEMFDELGSAIIFTKELVKSEFIAISQPIVGLLGNLKSENETLKELQSLQQQLDTRSGPNGFRREQWLLFYPNRYYVGTKSKLKALLLHEFHDPPSAGHGGVKKMLVMISVLFTGAKCVNP